MNNNSADKIIEDGLNKTNNLTNKLNIDPSNTDLFLELMFVPLDTASRLAAELKKNKNVNMENKENQDENDNTQSNKLSGKQLSRQDSIGSFGL